MEELETALKLETRIYFKKKFDSERYFIEHSNVFYSCTQTTVSPCDGIPLDEVPQYTEENLFHFNAIPGEAIDPVKLHAAAEQVIRQLKLRPATEPENDSKAKTRGAGAGTTFEESKCSTAESVVYKLLKAHEDDINKNLKDTRFKLDGDKRHLINDLGHKVVFYEDGRTESDLFADLDDANLPQKLVDDQIAVVKTLQALFRETKGACPKEVTNLFIIKKGLLPAEEKKVSEKITPPFIKMLKESLSTSQFDDIRHLLNVENEPIASKKREAESTVKTVGSDKKSKTERTTPLEKPEVKTTKALFCFDFDYTISNKHTHNDMFKQFDIEMGNELKFWGENRKACEDFIRGIAPLGDAAEWKKLFENLVESRNFVAIVSFNVFGKELIPFYLKEVIGLDDDFIRNHIKIVSFLPPLEEQNSKSKHIDQAKQELNLTDLSDDCVVLVDDDEKNIAAAKKAGNKTIHVQRNNAAHINTVLELSKTMKKAENNGEVEEQPKPMGFSR